MTSTPAGSSELATGPLPVLGVASEAIASCLRAAADLAELRTGHRPVIALSTPAVVAAVTSERRLRIDGQPVTESGFAPLSRFWPAAAGWVRTHANYAWHRAALLRALGIESLVEESSAEDSLTRQLGTTIAALPADVVQERVVAAGGVAAAVHDIAEWRAGEVARAAAQRPLIDLEVIGDARPRAWPGRDRPSGAPNGIGGASDGAAAAPAAPPLPCAGLRVLDLTRVIAGPVATRMLAALGAEVLRVDPPDRPELPLHVADGLVGKRSALLSAGNPDGRRRLHELVHAADVVVCGYRPGALDRLRLSPAALAYDHPGAVVVTLSAWGTTGPWARRRGFDSLVQAASGIATTYGEVGDHGDGRPGSLPCQLLDHATGYLAAAAALQALGRQRTEGGTQGAWVSLARTAQWLLESSAEDFPGVAEVAEVELQDLGGLEVVPPPGSLDGEPLRWPGGRPHYGADAARWMALA